MSRLRSIYEAITTIVRPASVTAFTMVILAIAVTVGERNWAPWRRMGLGWRFWTGLGDESAILAAVCLPIGCFLAHLRGHLGDEPRKEVGWCLVLNLLTIVLNLFVPAINAF